MLSRRAQWGRGVVGALTVVVLLAQTAPSAIGPLAGLLHAAFHLGSSTAREGLEHRPVLLASHDRPGAQAHPGEAHVSENHTHPNREHSHAPESRTDTPHDRAQPSDDAPPSAEPDPQPLVHTHGPGEEPHTHAPVVDRLLRMAATVEGPSVAPTGPSDPRLDRYLHPDALDPPAPVPTHVGPGAPVEPFRSQLPPRPTVPPPRG